MKLKLKIVTGLLSMILMLGIATPVFAYDQGAAQRYADKHVFNYNVPPFENYAGRGGDCANFVSQCLYAGGLTQTGTWKQDSRAWINADGLKNYMRDNLGATKLSNWAYNAGYRGSTYYYSYHIDNSSNIQGLGSEVVFYDWDGNHTMDHASIVVGTSHPYQGQEGQIATYDKTRWGDLIDAHTKNMRHKVWNLLDINNRYDTTLIYVFRLK